MHRNTKLLIIILAMMAVLVIGVNIGRSFNPAVPAPAPAPTPSPTIGFLSYNSAKCGIALAYPGSLKLSESTMSGTQIIDPINLNTLPTTIVCQPGIPRIALPPDKIESYVVANGDDTATAAAKLYHDTSQKDGTPIDKLIFTNPVTRTDVFISGYGDTYKQILSTLKLL